MVQLNSAVKKNKGTQKTRKELMNKSPIPWLVILIITGIGGGFLVYPNASDWFEKRKAITEMENDIPELKASQKSLAVEKDNLSENFASKAGPYIAIADQRYPIELDKIKVTQIMEIYSILKQVNNRQNTIDLKSLTITDPRNIDGLPMASTNMSLNFVIDRPMLEDLFKFIQTGEISRTLEDQVLKSGGGETASIEFLKTNKLPVATISNVSLNEERGTNEDERKKEIYNAQIQVLLYSEPL